MTIDKALDTVLDLACENALTESETKANGLELEYVKQQKALMIVFRIRTMFHNCPMEMK